MPNERLKLHLDGHPLGNYVLIQRISAGGMAEIYLAEERPANQEVGHTDQQLEQTDTAPLPGQCVAMKVVCPRNPVTQGSGLADIAERFTFEGDLLKRLHHPHILPVYSSGNERGLLYYVMEYFENGSLADAVYNRSPQTLHLPLPFPEALSIIRQVSGALQYIHEQGIVHRDVKPGNLLGSIDGQGHWQVMLSDFGVARRIEDVSQANEQVTGTVAYMAPEEFSGEFSPASDQYSLAVVAYQLLTGHLPFEGSIEEQIAAHLEVIAPSVRMYREDIPWQIEEVIARALEKRPEDRYPSIAAFAESLELALAEAESGETTVPSTRLVQARAAHLAHQRPQPAFVRRLSYRSRTQVTVAAAALLFAALMVLMLLPGGFGHSLAFTGRPNASQHSYSGSKPAAGTTPTQGVSATATVSSTATVPTPITIPNTQQQTDSASLIALSAPRRVPVSHRFSFTVTLVNTGSSTWEGNAGYRLMCDLSRHPVQNCPSGFAADLGSYAVAPGGTITFTITLTALSAPGTFTAWMNMAHSSSLFESRDILVQVAIQSAQHSGDAPPAPTQTPASTATPQATQTPSPTPQATKTPTPTSGATPQATQTSASAATQTSTPVPTPISTSTGGVAGFGIFSLLALAKKRRVIRSQEEGQKQASAQSLVTE